MLDEIMTDIAEAGWLFNNCYQIDSALWRVNLRRPADGGDYFSDWAEGETLVEALEVCMTKLADAEFTEEYVQTYGTEPTRPRLNPRGLLQSLGLAKPFVRRI